MEDVKEIRTNAHLNALVRAVLQKAGPNVPRGRARVHQQEGRVTRGNRMAGRKIHDARKRAAWMGVRAVQVAGAVNADPGLVYIKLRWA